MNKIRGRKRGIRNPRIVARKYKVLFRIVLLLIVVFSIFYMSYTYVYMSTKFMVDRVTIVGTGRFVNPGDFKAISEQNTLGKSIFSIDPKTIGKTLSANFLGAKNVYISKDYPSTLVIKVEERVPMATVSPPNSDLSYLIDREGYILGEVSGEFRNLPEIIYEGEIKIGSFINEKLVPVSIEILTEAENSGLKVSSISFKERYSKLYLGHSEVYLSNFKSVKESVQVLSKLYKNLILEGKTVRKIDLRYDKVIVLYE